MKLCEHNDSYSRLCEERAREFRTERLLTTLVVVGRALLHGLIASAVVCALGWLVYDCGNVADANPAPAVVESMPDMGPDAPMPALPPDAEVVDLEARMRAWQPTSRAPVDDVAAAIVRACRRDPWPTPERCPALIASLAWRESAWRATAVGPPPWRARGLLQVHGVARMGWTDAELRRPGPGATVGLAWLRHLAWACRYYEPRADYEARVLGAFGRGGCKATMGARLVLRGEREIGAVTP